MWPSLARALGSGPRSRRFKSARPEKLRRCKMKSLVIVIGLCLVLGNVYAVDLPDVLKRVEEKYARFEQEIQDMTILQDMVMITSGGEMTQDIKLQNKGKKFRMESKMEGAGMPGGMETVTIYDGKDTWMISPFTGKQKISDLGGNQNQVQSNWWDYISENSTITGSEEVSGRECHVISVSGNAPFDKLWLDKNSFDMVKAEFSGAGGTMLLVYSDFRKVKGDWDMPYKTEMYQGKSLFSTSVTKSIEVNKGLSDELFDANKVQMKASSMEDMMKQMMQGQ